MHSPIRLAQRSISSARFGGLIAWRKFATLAALALPVAGWGQVALMSGYNFGQFLGPGLTSLDATTFDAAGSIGANFRGRDIPPPDSAGGFVANNGLAGNYSNGSGRLYWDGTNGSSAYDFSGGEQIIVGETGPNSTNGTAVYGTPPNTIGFQGDDLNLGLTSQVAGNKISFVQVTTGYFDYDPDQYDNASGVASDANLTFAALVSAPMTISWFINSSATPFATTNVTGTGMNLYSLDLPAQFYGQSSVRLIAQFSGAGITIDNIQFNGATSNNPGGGSGTQYWVGGAGTWSAATTGSAWQNASGSTSGAWASGIATFRGTDAGTVTVDNASGQVTFKGLAFETTGYTVSGDPIETDSGTASVEVRVGEASSAGEAVTATIASEITGSSAINKTGAGTLILSGANTYAGGTTISAGTLQLGAGGTSGSVDGAITNNGTLVIDRSDAVSMAGVISGSGALVQQGLGTTTLTAVNTYSGTTSVTGGTLLINGNQTGSGAITVSNGGRLGGTGTTAGAVLVQSGGSLISRTTHFTMAGLVLQNGSSLNVSLGAPSATRLFQVNGGLTLGGNLNIANAGGFGTGAVPQTFRLIDYTGTPVVNAVTITSAPVNFGDLAVQTSVANQVNLIFNPTVNGYWAGGAGAWAPTGGTAWTNFAASTAVAWTPQVATFRGTAGAVTVDGAGVTATGLQFLSNGYSVTGGAITTNTANTVVQVGDTTSAGSSMTATISSVITGTGGLNKTDAGTLVLSGNNTYAGATTVSGGTLEVNGTQGSSAVIVVSGARLGGSGAVGNVSIADGGTLVGRAGSFFTMSGLTLAEGATIEASLGAPSTNRLFQVNGNLTLDGVLNVSNAGGFGQGLYRIINYTGTLTDNGLNVGTLPNSQLSAEIQTSVANQVNLFLDSGPLPNWTGGSGTWSNDAGLSNWGSTDGSAQAGWKPGLAIFSGTAGTVTVDDAAGAVVFTGLQFATDGYTVTGDNLTTNTASTMLRVGDGANGAAMTATIASNIVGTGGVQKTDEGRLILTGTNTYSRGTTITDGILQLGNGGSAGSIIGNVVNNAALVINRSNSYTLAGTISGSGELTQQGTGTTILTADNTYTGKTTIAAGVLQIGAGGSTGAVAGDIVNNATLAINRTGTLELAGNISGTGALIHQGAGTTILAGNNSYAGGTTIEAGILQIGNGGTTGNINGNIVNRGTLSINRSNLVTMDNAISGTGSVSQEGDGVLRLTGANTYSGGTAVRAGALEVTADTNLGAAAGGITLDGGTLRALSSFNTTRTVALSGAGTIDTGTAVLGIQGAISGSGPLTKSGTGTLSLSGNNTYTGATTISQGEIMLNNSSLSGTTVAATGKLSGTGTIRGNLTNRGTLSPGASPGTLRVTGNFTQGATGVYNVELASATSFDALIIDGSATLDGTLNVVGLNGYVPDPGQTYQILQATGGIFGTFATVNSPWAQSSPMLSMQALYGTNDVRLSLTQLPFSDLTGSLNQVAMGRVVDAAIAARTIPELQKALNALPSKDAVREALREISPQRYERWFQQSLYNTDANTRAIEGRLDQVLREARASLWSEVVARESDFDGGGDSANASSSTSGILVGGDVRVTPDMQLGLVFDYTTDSLDLDDAGSSTDSDQFGLSVYTRYEYAPAFIETILGAGRADLESRRVIDIPGYENVASGDTKTLTRHASLRAGYTLDTGASVFTPYLGLSYVGWTADAFNETGGGQANLKIGSQSAHALASRLGVSFARPYVSEEISFTPRFDIAWRHDFHSRQRTLAANLGGAPFTLGADATPAGVLANNSRNSEIGTEGDNGLIFGLSLNVTFGSRLTAYLRATHEWTTAADKALEARLGAEVRF